MPEPVQKALNAQIPLPYAILLMFLGFGGSGSVGILTRDSDISAVQVMIREAKADEMDHYKLLLEKMSAMSDKIDRLEMRIDNIYQAEKEKP